MSDILKVFSNGAAVYSEEHETQILFLQKRISINEKGEPTTIGEQQALVTMTFENAKILKGLLEQNIIEHEKRLSNASNGGEKG